MSRQTSAAPNRYKSNKATLTHRVRTLDCDSYHIFISLFIRVFLRRKAVTTYSMMFLLAGLCRWLRQTIGVTGGRGAGVNKSLGAEESQKGGKCYKLRKFPPSAFATFGARLIDQTFVLKISELIFLVCQQGCFHDLEF